MSEAAVTKSELDGLETRLLEHSERSERRLLDHTERIRLELLEHTDRTRIQLLEHVERVRLELSEGIERSEASLLKEFRKWAISFESKFKANEALVVGFSERLTSVEERLGDLEQK
jgi:hypothetical protein